MPAYYNEFDPFAAEWLKKLIDQKLIAAGDVDVRSITEVQSDDLKGYNQVHFFAGIGGWSHALRLAGCDDNQPIWTGSCPCQSFSSAGKQKGKADERHLWPVWFRLIRECRPATVFGEQVANAITHEWLDEVATDLETEGYAFGSAVLPACSVGAPHRRDRLFFVANSTEQGSFSSAHTGIHSGKESAGSRDGEPQRLCSFGNVAHAIGTRISDNRSGEASGSSGTVQKNTEERKRVWFNAGERGDISDVGNAESKRCREAGQSCARSTERFTDAGAMGDTSCTRSPAGLSAQTSGSERVTTVIDNGSGGQLGPWSECEWITGHDGKSRPVKPGIRLLAHGVSNRVGKLRGLGNAIEGHTAATFIRSTGFVINDTGSI